MTPRERVEKALHGGHAEKVPFTMYESKIPQCAAEREMRNRGMCIVERRVPVFRSLRPNVKVTQQIYHEESNRFVRTFYETPHGTLTTLDQPVPIVMVIAFRHQRALKIFTVDMVDDEPAVTEMIARAIRSEHPDYEVAEAHDGFKAGSIIATLKPDVVILDLRMPGMDGFEVCKSIKSEQATRHSTVIAVTAYDSEENTRRIMDCGAAACLPKPLDLSELLRRVEAAVKSTGR